VTFYETTGWRGVMETERGSPVPEKFPSLPGTVFPAYHVLADLAGCDRWAPTLVSAPSRIAALTIFGGNGRFRLLLGNLTPQAQHVRVSPSMPSAHLRMLDSTSVASAMREPEEFRAHASAHVTAGAGAIRLGLPPYAVARLDPP
jgi:hypothetical protein